MPQVRPSVADDTKTPPFPKNCSPSTLPDNQQSELVGHAKLVKPTPVGSPRAFTTDQDSPASLETSNDVAPAPGGWDRAVHLDAVAEEK